MINFKNKKEMTEWALKCVRITVIVTIGFVVYNYAFFIKGQAILSLLDVILTVSGLLFAVFGAWLALLAGPATAVIESKTKTRAERDKQVDYIAIIVSPMTTSAMMVALGMFMKITSLYAVVMIKDPFWVFVLKQEALFVLTVCFFYQCWYLLRACGVGLYFLMNMERKSCANSFDDL